MMTRAISRTASKPPDTSAARQGWGPRRRIRLLVACFLTAGFAVAGFSGSGSDQSSGDAARMVVPLSDGQALPLELLPLLPEPAARVTEPPTTAAAQAPVTAAAAPAPTEPPAPPVTEPPPPPPPPAPSGSVEGAIYAYFPDVYEQALSVARCESGLNPSAVSSGGGNHGLFQINTVHRGRVEAMGYTWDQIYDPYVNSHVARSIYDESGWQPWTCRP